MDVDQHQETHNTLSITADRLFRMHNEGLQVLQKATLHYEREKKMSTPYKHKPAPSKSQTELDDSFSFMAVLLNHVSWHCK